MTKEQLLQIYKNISKADNLCAAIVHLGEVVYKENFSNSVWRQIIPDSILKEKLPELDPSPEFKAGIQKLLKKELERLEAEFEKL